MLPGLFGLVHLFDFLDANVSDEAEDDAGDKAETVRHCKEKRDTVQDRGSQHKSALVNQPAEPVEKRSEPSQNEVRRKHCHADHCSELRCGIIFADTGDHIPNGATTKEHPYQSDDGANQSDSASAAKESVFHVGYPPT